MRRPLRWLLVFVGLLVLVVVGEVGFFAWAARGLPPDLPPASPPSQIRGAYHVHSRLSDGRGTPEEIARAAAAAGLHFVVLTDHNLIDVPPPRWVDGVLLVFQAELSTPSGHLVALGIKQGLSGPERDGDVLGSIHAQGGAGFIAHPVQIKCPWLDWAAAKQADGMELYSGDSFLRDALSDPARILLPAAGTYLVRPEWGLWMLARPNPPTRDRQVEMSNGRRVSGLCAHDAHGIPAYATAFRALSIYLESTGKLVADPTAAAQQVIGALRGGDFHCGFGSWASADGFILKGDLSPNRESPVGATLELVTPLAPPGNLRVEIHGDAGATLGEGDRRLHLERAGLLWVEIWVQPTNGARTGWLPWIVSSPIRVVSQ